MADFPLHQVLALVRARPRISLGVGLILVLGLGGVLGLGASRLAPRVAEPGCSATTALRAGDTYFCAEEHGAGKGAAGPQWWLSPGDTPLIVVGEGRGTIRARADASFQWDLTFQFPDQQSAAPGVYQATTLPTDPQRARLRVTGPWTPCGTQARFQILELVTGANGFEIEHFAANFEVDCPERGVTYAGAVRWHARVGVPAALTPPPTPRPVASCLAAIARISDTTYACIEHAPDDLGPPASLDLLTPARTIFTPQLAPAVGNDAVGFQVSGPTGWHLEFATGDGTPLAVGRYEQARLYPFGAGHPQMTVDEGHTACGELTGRFEVLDLARDPVTGAVTRFAVNFEHHCQGATAGLRGALRYHSPVPLDRSAIGGWGATAGPTGTPAPTPVVLLPVPVCAGTGGAGPVYTVLCVFQEAADPGGPRRRLFTPSDATFSGSGPALHTRDMLLFDVRRDESWSLMFGPPAGQKLTPGLYSDANNFGLATDAQAILSLNGSGFACGPPSRFQILESELSSDGETVRRFAANFEEQPCPGGWQWIGVFRFHSTVPP